MRISFKTYAVSLALVAVSLLSGCERPPVKVEQIGYRGTGMEQVINPRTVAANAALHVAPPSAPAAGSDGPKAKDIYKNVQVLGDLSVGEFTRHMISITSWVAPEQGCTYCHNPANLAEDSKYTKIVARRMIQMTQHVNEDWKNHVKETGVTCYTCHRGQPVPSNIWFKEPPSATGKLFLGNAYEQNKPAKSVGLSTLPYDPFTTYLLGDANIKVGSKTALPTGENEADIKSTEKTYGLMMHMSAGLGVNCTYCHNAQNFSKWDGSPPERVQAWYGIRMVRDLNNEYMVPLTGTFPAERKGALGDVAKQNCLTCHQGVNKPLNGASMAKDHPELLKKTGSVLTAAAVAAPGAVAAAQAGPSNVLGKVLFATGLSKLDSAGAKEIAAVVDMLKKNMSLKVDVSGFADTRGSIDKNMELSKLRAFAVRDALSAGGVAADRINLKKPEMAVAGGAESDSRRVDIVSVK